MVTLLVDLQSALDRDGNGPTQQLGGRDRLYQAGQHNRCRLVVRHQQITAGHRPTGNGLSALQRVCTGPARMTPARPPQAVINQKFFLARRRKGLHHHILSTTGSPARHPTRRATLTSSPIRACTTQRHWTIPMDSMEKVKSQ